MELDSRKIILSVLFYLSLSKNRYVSLAELMAQINQAYVREFTLKQWMNMKSQLIDYLNLLKQWNFISEKSSGDNYFYKIELPGICYLRVRESPYHSVTHH